MPALTMFGTTPINFWIELIYSLIVIISCGIIYLRTRELYKLTFYKGIKYFSNAFLFFGISVLSKITVRIITIFLTPDILLYTENFLNPYLALFKIGILISVYAGLMAGFYLIYSLIWKKIQNLEKFEWVIPLILSAIAIISMFTLKIFVLPITILLFLVAVILAHKFKDSKHKKGISQLHIIYSLLFASWIVNAIAHIFIIFSTITSIFLQLISICLFLVILYRVIEDTKRGK